MSIIQRTQHWFRHENGAWYRDVWVRFPDGEIKLVGIRDDLEAAA
jgi:hypothetical protein